MKKVLILSVLFGFGLASCTKIECLECSGTSSSFNACSNDSEFSVDPAFWDNYVSGAVNYAAGVGDSCTIVNNGL